MEFKITSVVSLSNDGGSSASVAAPKSDSAKNDSNPFSVRNSLENSGAYKLNQSHAEPTIDKPTAAFSVESSISSELNGKGLKDSGTKESLSTNFSAKYNIDATPFVKSNLTESMLPPSGLKYGQKNADVGALQNKYVELGLMSKTDVKNGGNNFGPLTRSATVKFQASLGVAPSGEFDAKTQAAMTDLYQQSIKAGSQNKGAVTTLQRDLVNQGFLTKAAMSTGPGTFGPKTEAALKAFQKANHIQQTGVYGPTTYKAMQLLKAAGLSESNSSTASSTKSVESTNAANSIVGLTAKNRLPTTAAEANQFFKTQFRTKFNPDGPGGSVNCGPTSVAMSLNAVGLLPASHKNKQIEDVRTAIGHAGLTGANDFIRVIPKFGGKAQILNPTEAIKKQINAANANQTDALTLKKVADQAWQVFDGELNKGNAIVLQGNITTKYRTEAFNDNTPLKGGAKPDTYGTPSYENYPHILAVVGKTTSGKYVVADPMSREGAVELSRSQLTLFLNGALNNNLGAPTNIVSVSNPER